MDMQIIKYVGGILVLAVLDTKAIIDPYKDCFQPLGMMSGEIEDAWISASSSYDTESVGPTNARLKSEKNGGAWCPAVPISQFTDEYLQIEFPTLQRITHVETQGRFGNGQGVEYVEYYTLEYMRQPGDKWLGFHNRAGEELFVGNEDTYTIVRREVNPPIIAQKIRIVPHSSHERTMCMRTELYGCQWQEGIVSYNMRQGERRGSELDFYDLTYDGEELDGYLSGGLGQLVDGETGMDNFRLDTHNLGKRGYQWVGWKNETNETPPVEIDFEFDTVRNFTSIRVHAHNFYSKDVSVFRMVKVYFSIGGEVYQDNPVVYKFTRDTFFETARHVIIPVEPQRVGQYVRMHFYYDARWIMLSEIKFESEISSHNYTEELPPDKGSTESNTNPETPTKTIPKDKLPSETDEIATEYTPEKDNKEEGISTNHQTPHHKASDDQFIGGVIGAVAAIIIICIVIIIFCIIRNRRRKNYENKKLSKEMERQRDTLDLSQLRALHNGKSPNGVLYSNALQDDFIDAERQALMSNFVNGKIASGLPGTLDRSIDSYNSSGIQTRELPDLPALQIPDSGNDTVTSRDYAVPDLTKSTFAPQGAYAPQSTFVPPPQVPPKPTSFSPHILEDTTLPKRLPQPTALMNLQGFSGASHYAVPSNMELLWPDNQAPVLEFPRDQLTTVEKLGTGQFGEVHLCNATMTGEEGVQELIPVAVKMLKPNAAEQSRADFHQEMRIMSRLRDPNIVACLGVCTQEEPLCILVEYMRHGDLNQFLRQHFPMEGTVGRHAKHKTLSYGCLIYMAQQIASGMKYVENLNMVHRDLATRNCLVGDLYTIKISDFGMSRPLYSSDYYVRENNTKMPIRWMAWESVLLGKFSPKSDVWSFAVTLWEILTFARERPFSQLASSDDVILNLHQYYNNSGQQIVLSQPPNCPREIYDLMAECWNRDAMQRPSFREIHMFLERKNMGYNPLEEIGLGGGGGGAPGMYGTGSGSSLGSGTGVRNGPRYSGDSGLVL